MLAGLDGWLSWNRRLVWRDGERLRNALSMGELWDDVLRGVVVPVVVVCKSSPLVLGVLWLLGKCFDHVRLVNKFKFDAR